MLTPVLEGGSMNSEYLATINRFSGLNVLVIGDAMLDVYLDGSANRICREAPVPIVDIKDVKAVPGGAANTAVNLAQLGARFTIYRSWGVITRRSC